MKGRTLVQAGTEELARIDEIFHSAFGKKVKGIHPYKLLDSGNGISEYVVGMIEERNGIPRKMPWGNLRVDKESITYRGRTNDTTYEIISARMP